MSELNRGLVAADPQPKDFGWSAPYVVIEELVPLEHCHPEPWMEPLRFPAVAFMGGLASWYWHNIRREEMRVARACPDRRAGHLAIYARKVRQRRKNWRRVVKMAVEESRKEFRGYERLR